MQLFDKIEGDYFTILGLPLLPLLAELRATRDDRGMKRACVIGWPIEHSRSPLIHGYWLKQYGIDGAYTKEAVPPEAVTRVPALARAEQGFVGCNVTVPHKEAAFAAADVRDASARAVGGGEHACGSKVESCTRPTPTPTAS